MKLVVLDGYFVGHGGLRLSVGPEHTVLWRDYTAPEEVAAAIGDAEAAVTGRAPIGEDVLAACPNLRYVGTMGTGFNMVDLAGTARRGIPVCNAPGYSESAVAQGAFALLLEIAGGISGYNRYVHEGKWTDPTDSGLTAFPVIELMNKTMGVVGLGSIGSAVARIAQAFGMRVVACSKAAGPDAPAGIPLLPLEELLAQSDVVSLHCPLSEETRGMIGERALAWMKDGAVLINTARGGLLDEGAVARALDSGKLAFLGADVLAQEPPEPDNPLARHPRTVITPHICWMAPETRRRLVDLISANFLAFAAGAPQNVVNGL